ncbi:hypothetical protein [Ferrovibrio xuzhouensis]|uniref:Uncharacterized protein n=1 Tax=Ferrovibrio xuzhouensis TaxID=1576914 RepID=A0ABV7VB68_9PROT
MKGRLKTICAVTILAAATILPAPAWAETSAARQARVANESFCAAVMRGSMPPAECHADLAHSQVTLVPAAAKSGTATMPVIAGVAHMAAVIAGQRHVAPGISVAESDKGMDLVTIDLDPAAVDDLSKLDNAAAAMTLVRARAQRCKVALTAKSCQPLAKH